MPVSTQVWSGGQPRSGAADTPERGAAWSELRSVGEEHFERVAATSHRFFETEADRISEACWAMARRFGRGGRLLVFASEGCASDGRHVSVEFVHPVIVGKRALPALVVEGGAAEQLRLLGMAQDIAMGITSAGEDPRVLEALRIAREMGLLTVGLAGGAGGSMVVERLDHRFVVPDADPTVVQEVHETLYHVLWELVHVFFEHEELL